MDQNPIQGSKIKVESSEGYELIVVPHGDPGITRFFIGVFLIIWLGSWFMRFTSAAGEVLSGKGSAFLILWLGCSTLTGVFAVCFFYRIFRSPIPEKLLLNKPNLTIDTGIPIFKMTFSMNNHKDFWKTMFPKRKRFEFTYDEIKSLKLRETDSGNRLTIDRGSDRIEIASSAKKIEREWLFNYLESNYS